MDYQALAAAQRNQDEAKFRMEVLAMLQHLTEEVKSLKAQLAKAEAKTKAKE